MSGHQTGRTGHATSTKELRMIERTSFRWLLLLTMTIALLAQPLFASAETVCIQCHSKQTGRGGVAPRDWRESIHAQNGISCQHCHGGDANDAVNAMSPARGFLGVPTETGVPAFCGRCHVGVLGDFQKSAHGRTVGHGGPTCVTCHGSHRVQKAAIGLISEQLCGRCHSYTKAAELKQALLETETTISQLSTRLSMLKGEGVDTDVMDKGLFAARNRYRTVFHEVDLNRIKSETGMVQQELNKISANLQKLDSERSRRKLAGGVAILATLIAAALLYLLKKSYS